MWPFKRKASFFTLEQNERIVESIRKAETMTSGEIRLFVESRCKYVDPLDRAAEIFNELKMFNTSLRNGVLLYVATRDRQMAIYADKGIHEAAGKDYWPGVVKHVLSVFSKDDVTAGIITMITEIGNALAKHFPFSPGVDKNELPDEIIFNT